MTPRRHSFPVPNTGSDGTHEIVFYDWGDIDAPRTVVCVHGLTRNAHDFDALAESLAKQKRRVFSINMAGRGESPWLADPMGYHYGTYAADCLAIMDNFHLRGVEWIGTSMGGIIGMMIAAESPGRIKKLVLNDIGIHLSKEALGRIYQYVSTMPKGFASRAEASAYLAVIYQSFGITDPVLWDKFVDASLTTDAQGNLHYACDPAIAVPLAAGSKNYTEVNDVNLISFWEKIDIPTFIIHGADSDVLTIETVKSMRSTNPRCESVTLPGIGHAPALMNEEQIRLVSQWLTGTNTVMLASGL